jgi:hypothetical protein
MASMPPPPMGGGMPPDQGPPPQMGAPTLANTPPSGPQVAGPEQGGALPRLVFQIEQSLQTLARALPGGSSQKIDSIREQLRGAVAEALAGGGAQPNMGPQQEGGPY